MFKKLFSNQAGLTFIELMIAISIIVIISMISVAYIKGDIKDEVERITDQFAADVRYTRNLAVSRTIFNFTAVATPATGLEDIYPPGGYGVYINKTNGTYSIFADSGIATDGNPIGYDADKDPIIKTVALDNSALFIGDLNNVGNSSTYFTFKSENDVDTNLNISSLGKYEVEINYAGPGYPDKGYRGVLSLGERSDEGYVWVSLGKSMQEYNHPAPPPGGSKYDPVDSLP